MSRNLNLKTKLEIIKAWESKLVSQKKFAIDFGVSTEFISKIVCNKDKISTIVDKIRKRQSIFTGKFPAVERVLKKFVGIMWENKMVVNPL
jgi:hypothetical protein